MKAFLLGVLVWWAACSDATPIAARDSSPTARFIRINFANLFPWLLEEAPPVAPTPTTNTVSVTTRAASEPFILGTRERAQHDSIIFGLPKPTSTSTSPPPEVTTSFPPEAVKEEPLLLFPGERRKATLVHSFKCMDEESPATVAVKTNETECTLSSGQIMFNGSCERLLAKGTFCGEEEWLVLVGEEEAQCQPRPCPFGHLKYNGECVIPSNTTVCLYGQMLYVEMTGEAYCDCEPGFIYDDFSGECYAQYEQGPCTFGNYLEFSENCSVECVPNECQIDGLIRGNDSNKTCYEKMYHGFCKKELQIFHQVNHTVECNPLDGLDTRNIFDVTTLRTCPAGSRRDHLQQCRQLFLPASTNYPSLYGSCSSGFIKDPRGTCRRVHSMFG